MAHICDSAPWKAKARGSLEARSSRPVLATKEDSIFTFFLNELGVVVHTCSPSYSGGWGRRITWAPEFKATVGQDQATALQPGQKWDPVSKKKKKISVRQVWWYMPVVAATWEAEVAKQTEPKSSRLQWAMTAPLYSILDDTARFCLKARRKFYWV